MTGPYRALVFLDADPTRVRSDATPDFVLTWDENRDDLSAGDSISYRYYNTGHGATLLGTLRAATFFVGAALGPGESAFIRLLGREVGRGDENAEAEAATIRRDEAGRVFTTLGSRWSRERHFVGL
jgi:hypothetical protein